MTTLLPRLGAGLGYRSPYHSDILWHRASISVLELTLEEFSNPSALQERDLKALTSQFPLLWHGIELSLGSAAPPSAAYLQRLRTLVQFTQAPWVSEHLSFVRAGEIEIGHLTPISPTRESLETVVRNVKRLQAEVEVPVLLENITRVIDLPGDLTEWEFMGEVLAKTGAGLLLDVTNLFINAVNRETDPMEELAQVPMECVVELHLAGGHSVSDYLIDSHSAPIPEEVWRLTEKTLSQAAVKAIIIERDMQLPPFADLLLELERAQTLWEGFHGNAYVA